MRYSVLCAVPRSRRRVNTGCLPENPDDDLRASLHRPILPLLMALLSQAQPTCGFLSNLYTDGMSLTPRQKHKLGVLRRRFLNEVQRLQSLANLHITSGIHRFLDSLKPDLK